MGQAIVHHWLGSHGCTLQRHFLYGALVPTQGSSRHELQHYGEDPVRLRYCFRYHWRLWLDLLDYLRHEALP
jgi:hypothetical protein